MLQDFSCTFLRGGGGGGLSFFHLFFFIYSFLILSYCFPFVLAPFLLFFLFFFSSFFHFFFFFLSFFLLFFFLPPTPIPTHFLHSRFLSKDCCCISGVDQTSRSKRGVVYVINIPLSSLFPRSLFPSLINYSFLMNAK